MDQTITTDNAIQINCGKVAAELNKVSNKTLTVIFNSASTASNRLQLIVDGKFSQLPVDFLMSLLLF